MSCRLLTVVDGGRGELESTQTWGGDSNEPLPAQLPKRWRLERRLGAGGQAEVWLAFDEELGEWVALKIFNSALGDTARERLRREVRIGRDLNHPALVRIFELIEGQGCVAVAMQWVPGGSLAARRDAGPLTVDEVINIAAQILEVLAHLHKHGIVHRDVKPSNLLQAGNGRVYLADLGLARHVEGVLTVTRTATAVGTPSYMAPEQLRAEPAVPATDLYGLGVSVYRLLTGVLPFEGSSDYDTAELHLNAGIPNPRRVRPDCPRWLARFIMRLLEKKPRDRWKDASAALRDFKKARGMFSPRRLRRAALAAAGAAVVTGAGVVFIGAFDRAPAEAWIDEIEVVAADNAGRELWRRAVDGRPVRTLVADLVGNGRAEVAVAVQEPMTTDALEARIVVLGEDGRDVAEIAVGGSEIKERYPHFRPGFLAPFLASSDLDGDGRRELVWWANHDTWFPSLIGASFLRSGDLGGPLISHSGHLHAVRTADLDGDGDHEVIAAGINNVLGFQLAVMIVDLERKPDEDWLRIASSPDDVSSWTALRAFNKGYLEVNYTVWGPYDGTPTIESAGPGGIRISHPGGVVEFDPWLNPSSSVLYNSDVTARRLVWDDLAASCTALQAEPATAADQAAAFLARNAEVLAEDPMHLAAVLLLARSAARGGEAFAAVDILEEARTRHPKVADLWLRLGEYQVSASQFGRALATLEHAAGVAAETPRAAEAIRQLVRLASFMADEPLFRRGLRLWDARYPDASDDMMADLHAMWSFFRGDWHDPSLDLVRASSDVREVDVARAWAQFERDGDAEAALSRAGELAADPETQELARVLEAYALLRSGDLFRAKGVAEMAVSENNLRARQSLQHALWLPLADRVLGEALLALGRDEEARPYRQRAADIAPRCWFGTRE